MTLKNSKREMSIAVPFKNHPAYTLLIVATISTFTFVGLLSNSSLHMSWNLICIILIAFIIVRIPMKTSLKDN
jgi:hypothetical protein